MSHVLRESQPLTYIKAFELELTLKSGENKEWEYTFDGQTVEAEVEYEHGDAEFEWTDSRALREVLGLMAQLGIRPEMSPGLLADRALAALGVRWDMVEELELEVAFSNGKAFEFEYASKDDEASDDEEGDRPARELDERDELSD